jgi:uncharacterized membrane protein
MHTVATVALSVFVVTWIAGSIIYAIWLRNETYKNLEQQKRAERMNTPRRN